MVKRKAASKVAVAGASSKRRKTSASPSPDQNKETDKPAMEPKVTRSVTKATLAQASDPTRNGGVHPLLIDHILDNVFQYVISQNGIPPISRSAGVQSVAKSVQNIRLVCKQWMESATRLFRRIRAPTPFGVVDPYNRTKSVDMRMQKFLETMKPSQLIPVQRYSINANFFVRQNQKLMKDFMHICGPEAVELRLYFDNTGSMNFNRRSFPDLNLMRLKTLAFQCESYRGKSISSQTHDIPYLVEVLLIAAENLQEFRFEFSSRDGKWHTGVVKRFGEIICKRIPRTVKILRLDMPLNDQHLNTLRENELKLEEFQFDCHCVAGREVIRRFFEKQTATLKVLKILDSSPSTSISLEFPRFEELLHMELNGANIKPFSYPDTFPKLRTLNISEWKTETTCLELLSCAKKCQSLKEIFLPYRFPQAPLVKKAANCFPNITKLHISPSPDIAETLQEAFVYFSNIEELYVSFPFLLDNELNADSIFSGVSEADCRRIMKSRNFGNFENVNVRDVQHKPSIVNLIKLKKLVLEDSACDVILTDFSAHFVFLKMASLNELHTSRFRMSVRYVDMLRERLTLKLVEDDYSDFAGDDSDGWSSDSSDMENDDELQIFPFMGMAFNVFFVR